ncbi:MAG: glycosyltransferase [Acidimicrobiales bacterium]
MLSTPGGDQPHRPVTSGDAEALRRRLSAAEAEIETLQASVRGDETLAAMLEDYRLNLERAEGDLHAAQAELGRFRSKRSVRYSEESRRALSAMRRRIADRAPPALSRGLLAARAAPANSVLREPSAQFPADSRYMTWVTLYDTLDEPGRQAVRARLEGLRSRPLISVVLPVFDPPESYLRAAIDSVRAQLYGNWELCISDDYSTAAWVPKVLAEYAAEDPRIRVERRSENGHISASSNTALGLATGEWIACFDHDDRLAEHALALAALALDERPSAGLLYSDEDHIDDDGVRSHPYFKPDFDPYLLLGQNYLSHLCMIRHDLVERVGGFRLGYEGSQDWDLALRTSELLEPDQVVHVPHVLYHWRVHPGSTSSSLSAKPYAARAARRSVDDHLDKTGQRGRALPIGASGFTRVRWELPQSLPAVSVIVLPRKGPRLVRCLDSVRVRSTYPDVELVVVDDGAERPPVRQFLRDREHGLTVVREDRDLSDSALRNVGAQSARGRMLCFLDDDIEVLTDHWLEEMVGLLLQPVIGAVGAKLLYPDGTVQHAGIVAGIGGTVGHLHRGTDRLEPGYFGRAMLSQCFSAVSSACMLVRREAFDEVGGFDEEHFGGLFGDVDFCFRLGEAGWKIGWTPYAEMLHFETREEARPTAGENAIRFARDIRYLQARWRAVLDRDPAYNPNLSLAHESASLAWPPRVSYV